MLYSLAAVLMFALGASAEHSRDSYEMKFFDWMVRFDVKLHSGEEFVKRLNTFIATDKFIDEHNASGETYRVAHNQFSMYTLEEFAAKFLSPISAETLRHNNGNVHKSVGTAPTAWDWTTQGAVTAVKNQGSCGSCWAFSTTGGLEGAYFLDTGSLVSYSEQQLVSCDKDDSGCNGGWMDTAFAWIQSNGGLCTEAAYPYTSGNGVTGTCQTSCTNVAGSTVTSWTDVTVDNGDDLLNAIYAAPVSVAIQANQMGFQMYSSGVYTGRCGNNLDHGVLAVGYGTSPSNFWKIKNSWGTTWGEAGYMQMERGKDQYCDQCGILCAASYPAV